MIGTYTLNTLSRLKGIETLRFRLRQLDQDQDSEYTFPFEGNWNLSSLQRYVVVLISEYTFPFEGNWNKVLNIEFLVFRFLTSEYTFPFEGNWNLQCKSGF